MFALSVRDCRAVNDHRGVGGARWMCELDNGGWNCGGALWSHERDEAVDAGTKGTKGAKGAKGAASGKWQAICTVHNASQHKAMIWDVNTPDASLALSRLVKYTLPATACNPPFQSETSVPRNTVFKAQPCVPALCILCTLYILCILGILGPSRCILGTFNMHPFAGVFD